MSLETLAKENGWVLLPDEKNYIHRIQFKGSTDRFFVIAFNTAKNEWCCNDSHWPSNHKCKHLKAMLPLIEKEIGK